MRSIQGTWKIVVFQVGEHVGLWHIIFFLCDMKVLQEDWKIEFYVFDIFLKFTSIVRQLLQFKIKLRANVQTWCRALCR